MRIQEKPTGRICGNHCESGARGWCYHGSGVIANRERVLAENEARIANSGRFSPLPLSCTKTTSSILHRCSASRRARLPIPSSPATLC